MRFANRVEAGARLAAALAAYRDADTVVLALPRGGVVVGAQVARALGAPLDLVIARKVGHPGNPEYALCAVTEDGEAVCNEAERARVDPDWLDSAIAREREEAARRRRRYLADRAPIPLAGKTVVLVDDGIATGLTMRAAIRQVRAQHPRRVVMAIPIIPPDTAERLSAEVDVVVALDIPSIFLGAVGAYYDDFSQVTDDEVIHLLQGDDPPALFALPALKELAGRLGQAGVCRGEYRLERFPNGELYITLDTPVYGGTALLLGTLAPPDTSLPATLLLAHTLRTQGAARVIALLPYLAYMRQDRPESGRSLAAAWLGALLPASGIDAVVTVDLHSPHAAALLPVPCTSLSPASLFAAAIAEVGWQDATLVAPDEGALVRCEAVRQAAGMTAPIIHCVKRRSGGTVTAELRATPGSRAIVIDDILDTGRTLLACCDALHRAGAASLLVMVTHGLFTGDAWQGLWTLGVREIYCTNTVPRPEAAIDTRVRALSVLPLFTRWLREEKLLSAP